MKEKTVAIIEEVGKIISEIIKSLIKVLSKEKR